MQLRFVYDSGSRRLNSLDHDGCFVSDRAVRPDVTHALQEQLRMLDHALVLENAQREVFILLPTYRPQRPQVLSCPMSTVLIIGMSWRVSQTIFREF